METAYIAVYGNIQILRGQCPRCGGTALILDNIYRCCNIAFIGKIKGYKFEVECSNKRVQPPLHIQEYLLAKHDNHCLYCCKELGKYIKHRNKLVLLKVTWDHFIPYSYLQDNPEDNWVLSCQICNGIKSNKIFETLKEAKEHIYAQRETNLSTVQERVYHKKRKTNLLPARLQGEGMARKKSKSQTYRCIKKVRVKLTPEEKVKAISDKLWNTIGSY